MRINRPKFCYDKDCKVILSTYEKESFDEGLSFFCFGKLKEPHKFKEKETVHENNISHCYYTPLKGMIRYFMNTDDLWGEAQAKIRVLNKLIKVDCKKCGERMNRVIRYICFSSKCNPKGNNG